MSKINDIHTVQITDHRTQNITQHIHTIHIPKNIPKNNRTKHHTHYTPQTAHIKTILIHCSNTSALPMPIPAKRASTHAAACCLDSGRGVMRNTLSPPPKYSRRDVEGVTSRSTCT